MQKDLCKNISLRDCPTLQLLTFCEWYHLDFLSLLTLLAHNLMIAISYLDFMSVMSKLESIMACPSYNSYLVHIHLYHLFRFISMTVSLLMTSFFLIISIYRDQWAIKLSTYLSFVASMQDWYVVNICINSYHLFLNRWLFFYDIRFYFILHNQYSNPWTFIAHFLEIMLPNISELLIWFIDLFFLHIVS